MNHDDNVLSSVQEMVLEKLGLAKNTPIYVKSANGRLSRFTQIQVDGEKDVILGTAEGLRCEPRNDSESLTSMHVGLHADTLVRQAKAEMSAILFSVQFKCPSAAFNDGGLAAVLRGVDSELVL